MDLVCGFIEKNIERKKVQTMRIDAYNQISQVYGVKPKTSVKATGKAVATTDKVEISSFARDYQIARQSVAASSDVRMDKVNDIKSRISNGTYDMDSASFADMLLDKLNNK